MPFKQWFQKLKRCKSQPIDEIPQTVEDKQMEKVAEMIENLEIETSP